jgi:predicted phosphohydrolase
MKLYVMSDLHLEFAPFEPDYSALEVADVVVLAGDIHLGTNGLRWARDTFADKPIVYVAGNHEFYGQHWTSLLDDLRRQAPDFGIHFLENESVTLDSIRFLGCSLWTDFDFFGRTERSYFMQVGEARLNDYRLIEAVPLEVKMPSSSVLTNQKLTAMHTRLRHQSSLAWLRSELAIGERESTVVVTHHCPSARSTPARYLNDELTACFASRLPMNLLVEAKIWIHGHSHDRSDYQVEHAGRSVRVICNPRGYPRSWQTDAFENSAFNTGLLIELDSTKESS